MFQISVELEKMLEIFINYVQKRQMKIFLNFCSLVSNEWLLWKETDFLQIGYIAEEPLVWAIWHQHHEYINRKNKVQKQSRSFHA